MMVSFYYNDQNPSGFCFLVQISAFDIKNLVRITKFKCERKNEKNSGRSSKMTPLCKWPIDHLILRVILGRGILGARRVFSCCCLRNSGGAAIG